MEVKIHGFDPCSPRALTVTSVTGLPCIGGLRSPIIIIFISSSTLSLFNITIITIIIITSQPHCTLSVTVEVLSIAAAMIPLYWMIFETLPAQISSILNPASNFYVHVTLFRTARSGEQSSRWAWNWRHPASLSDAKKLMIWLNVKLWIKHSDSMMFTRNGPEFLTIPVGKLVKSKICFCPFAKCAFLLLQKKTNIEKKYREAPSK